MSGFVVGRGPSGNALNVKNFGAKGDGLTDDTAKLKAAFERGGDIYVPPGVYMVTNGVLWSLKADTRIHLAAGATIRAAAGFPVDTKLIMASCDGNKRVFEMHGGTLDGRAMPARSVGAPDLLYLADPNFTRVRVVGVAFICNDDHTGTAGDSGLFLAEGNDFEVTGCYFQGCTDAGVYISGDNTMTKGRRAKVLNCTFAFCTVGVISKRVFEDHVIDGCIVDSCINGIVIGGEGGPTLGAGRKAVISNNHLRRVQRGIEARLADGTVITGNRIEEFGVTYTGAAVHDHGISLAGSKKCVVIGNVLSQADGFVPHAGNAGVQMAPRDFDGQTYASNENLVSGNVISGSSRGVYEVAGCDLNIITANLIAGVGTRVVAVGLKSVVHDIDQSASVTKLRVGASGQATPVPGATQVVEDDQGIIINYLTPSNGSAQWIVGDVENNAAGRFGYDHVADQWTWRAGGSGIAFAVRSDGPAFGNFTAGADAPATGYITIRDSAGTLRKIPVIA